MTRRVQLVRLVGACLLLLVGVLFCLEFSSFQLAALAASTGYPMARLPRACRFFSEGSHWLLLLPPLLFALGIRRLLRERTESVQVEVLQQLAVVLAALLVLGCIVAWQVPYAAMAVESF